MTALAACRTCGTEPLEHARFCHGCGSPVNDADSRAVDGALPRLREAVDDLFRAGQFGHSGTATGALVETLLAGAGEGDIAEAAEAVDRLAAAPGDKGLVSREIHLLRLRALLAQARGDQARYLDLRDRYRDMATSLGFEGHIAWAEAMT